MKGILAIYRREMGSYFVSPIAYIVIGFFLLATGVFFYLNLSGMIRNATMMAAQGREMDVATTVIRNFVGLAATFTLFLAPMLTMGVYAEERKRGTMEMLMTSPISEFQIVMGKFLASLTLYLLMLAPTLIYHGIVSLYSDPALPWRLVWAGYLGVALLGSSLVAIGSFISSLTESQIVAGIVTFVVFLMLWVLDIGINVSSSAFGEVVKYLSILQHYEEFAQGVIDTTSIVYYVSLTALALFLTLRNLDSMRWRRA
jgi:ABC-2 type transport system permease protein